MTVIDLTHAITPDMPVYPGTEKPVFTPANSYEKDGFGEVCLDKSQLVDAIIAHLNNDMKPEERYLERMEAYFPLFDNRNCERIYNEIVKN